MELPGIGGIFIILLTLGIIAVIALITFIIALYQAVYGGRQHNRRRVLQLFIISLVLLAIDFLFVLFNRDNNYFVGHALDDFGIFVWLPIHMVGGVLIVFVIWFFNRAKTV